MKVYLIRRRNRRNPAFYAEVTKLTEYGEGPRLRGRLERWTRKVRSVVLRASRRAGPRTTRALGWLMQRPNPDEPLLRALSGAASIELFHPESMSANQAQRLWFKYLRHRQRQQLGAVAWDLLLVAVTAPMLIMPGPGVLAFWFLYRAMVHLLAMVGTLRARSRRLPVSCQGVEALDLPVAPGDDVELAHISEHCGIQGLETYLRRLEKRTQSPNVPHHNAVESASTRR